MAHTLNTFTAIRPCFGFSKARDVSLFRRSLEMGLPKIPVRPGDKWISDEIVPFPQAGTVQVKLNAKFDGIVDREGQRQLDLLQRLRHAGWRL